MANAPQVTSFTSSAQAFKYPLPTVRQFNKQLQVTLDEKNARLRTLVGGSYRQLLGTAEMIVKMRRDIELTEGSLAKVAEGCSRTAIGKKVTGLGKLGLVRDVDPHGVADLGWLARMKVLDGCLIAIAKLLRGKKLGGNDEGSSRGARLVAAAKVWVLSRLLTKTLGDEPKNAERRPDDSERLLEDMRRKLEGLKRRLLGLAKKMQVKTDGNRDELVQALCAYGLAESCGTKDILRHFMHVRVETMALVLENERYPGNDEKVASILRALALYTGTLLDVQALVPRQLSDSLLGLKKFPLLKDDTIRGLEGLRLDLCERWLGDEIMFFTPYIRHDELQGLQAVEMLKSWAKAASEVLLYGLKNTVGHIVEIKTIVDLRTRTYESWILEGGKAKGFDPSIMLDDLRKVINDRLVNLIEARISKLRLVGTEIAAVVDSFSTGLVKGQGSFWNRELLGMDLGGGAGDFKEAIVSGVHGRDNSVARVVKGYETWRHLIDEVFAIIDQLKGRRWDDNLESLEDDEVLEGRNDTLSNEDPQMLQAHLDASLVKAFKDLHQTIEALVAFHHNNENSGKVTKFILRVLRDIRASLPERPVLQSFGSSMIPELHTKLAMEVSATPVSSFIASMSKQKRVVGRALWEGNPELPIQLSPTTFRFLRDLTTSMANAGNDLWSATAVGVLKELTRQRLGLEWSKILDSEESQANGHKEENQAEPMHAEPEISHIGDGAKATQQDGGQVQDILIQALFDINVFEHCLNSLDVKIRTNPLGEFEMSLRSRTDLTNSSNRRLRQASQDYWKRTYLLFGLLS